MNTELAQRLIESLMCVRSYMRVDVTPYVDAMAALLTTGRISADQHESLCKMMALHPAPTDTLLEQELEELIA